MYVWSSNCLKSKYLSFFSARWVSRYAGMDVRLKRNKLSPAPAAGTLSQVLHESPDWRLKSYVDFG